MRKKIILVLVFFLWASAPFVYSQSAELTEEETKFLDMSATKGLSQAQIFEGLGVLGMRKQELKKAETYFEKALELDSALDQSWFCLGLIHMKTGDPEFYFLKNIELAPKYNDAYYWLATYYCRANRIDDSIKYFNFYLSASDKYNPGERGRIKMASHFVEKMQAGVTDYQAIIKSAPTLDVSPQPHKQIAKS